MKKTGNLSDYIDLKEIQQIQNRYADSVGTALAVVDSNGRIVVPDSAGIFGSAMQLDDVCRQPEVVAACKKANKTRRVEIVECSSLGLVVAVAPVVHEEVYLGNWVAGQRMANRTEADVVQALTGNAGLKKEDAERAAKKLAVYSADSIQSVLQYLEQLAGKILQWGTAARVLQVVMDSSEIAVCVTDYHTGEILSYNRKHAQQYGLGDQEFLGQTCWKVFRNKTDFCIDCPREKLLNENGAPNPAYTWTYHNKKRNAWIRSTNSVVEWADGRLAHVITQVDVTNEKRLQQELGDLAYRDRQFDIFNNTKLLLDVEQIQQAGLGEQAYLVPFDISSMRQFNETYGRAMGDKLLSDILNWIRQQEFPDVSIYRVEGDAFCMLFCSSETAELTQMIKRVVDRFEEPWVLKIADGEISYICGVAIGGFLVQHGDDDIMSLMERILESSRQSGKFAQYDEEMDRISKERVRVSMLLKNCINNNMQGFSIHFQPIVEVSSGKWKGLETLCRWESPELGNIPPDVFIREAEQMGLINILGLWVLEEALKAYTKYDLQQYEDTFITVNLSPVQIMDYSFADKVVGLLEKHGFDGKNLVLEVTESSEFALSEYTVTLMEKLRKTGIRIALDDFGSGYSSFGNLKNIPAMFLKTEREFVPGIEDDNYLQFINFFMTEIAHTHGMYLVVEGIETAEQLETVVRNGADFIQGFYFSKPLTETQLQQNLCQFNEPDNRMFNDLPKLKDIEGWLRGEEAYAIAPGMFRVLNQSIRTLMTEDNVDTAFHKVLEQMGEYFKFSRASAYVIGQDEKIEKTYVWCRQGTDRPPMELERIAQELQKSEQWGENIITSDVDTLEEGLKAALKAQDTVALVAFPLHADGKIIGYIAFDETYHREWFPDEIIMLWNLSMMLGNSIEKGALIEAVDKRTRTLAQVMDSTDLNVFVSDIETHEILWANSSFMGSHGGEGVIGRPCHQVLRGEKSPCAHCKVHELLENPTTKYISFEHHNDYLGKDYLLYDSIINWQDGKKVHMEFGLDITEMKRAQRAAENVLSSDILGSAMNREALQTHLNMMFNESRQQETDFSIALVNLDGEPGRDDDVNDAANTLAVVDMIRRQIRGNDIIVRVGEGEYLIIMRDCKKDITKRRICKAQRIMDAITRTRKDAVSFSFGTADSSEQIADDCADAAGEMMDAAHTRMSRQKRQRNEAF